MQTRTIWTDGRAHEEDPDPSFMGDSVGHWDGDTLVVETRGISGELEIDTGWPHSDQFVLTERIHLDPADPNVLVNEMRMEDPGGAGGAVRSDDALPPRPLRQADRVPVLGERPQPGQRGGRN